MKLILTLTVSIMSIGTALSSPLEDKSERLMYKIQDNIHEYDQETRSKLRRLLDQALVLAGTIKNRNLCYNAVQGKIAWDYNGNKNWSPKNINRLCKGAERTREPASCFRRVMFGGINWGNGTKWLWNNALDLCEGTHNSNQTIRCFQNKIRNGLDWKRAIRSCESQ